MTNSQKPQLSSDEYCVCGKSQSVRRPNGSLYCVTCGKDYHPDNFEPVVSSSKERVVPTFEGRLFTDSERHGLAGNWVRRAEVDVLLDEIERLRGDLLLSQNAVSALGRQRSDWKAAYEGAIQRNAHETGEARSQELQRIYTAWRNGTTAYSHQDVSVLLEEITRLRPSLKANVVVVGPTCGKDTPDGPCRSDIGHEGDCDGLPY